MSYSEAGALTEPDLLYVCDIVYREAAIVLSPEKAYLIEARLEPLARREGFGSTTELVRALRTGVGPASDLRKKVIDAMTTNETSFFRDLHPFTALRKHVIPEVLARKDATKQLNIWCAACSSGQEPFTIAMLLADSFPHLSTWKMSFVASDISEEMLARCRAGVYSKLEVNRGLPAPMLVKYFEQQGGDWQIKSAIRDRIDFRCINLVGTWPFLPRFDIVFMRNVLIYFDTETKRQIFERVRSVLDPQGYLFLGGTETTLNVDDRWHKLRVESTTCYSLTPREMPLAPAAASAG